MLISSHEGKDSYDLIENVYILQILKSIPATC